MVATAPSADSYKVAANVASPSRKPGIASSTGCAGSKQSDVYCQECGTSVSEDTGAITYGNDTLLCSSGHAEFVWVAKAAVS